MKWLQDDLKAHKTMPTIIYLHFLVNDVPGLTELCAISGSNPYIEKLYQDLNISELSRERATNYLNDILPRLGDNYVKFVFGSLSDRSINISLSHYSGSGTVNETSLASVSFPS